MTTRTCTHRSPGLLQRALAPLLVGGSSLLIAPVAQAQYVGPVARPSINEPAQEARDYRLQGIKSPPPRAPEPLAPAFGAEGEWVISGASSLGAGWAQYDNSNASQLSLLFSPGFDVFVARNFSLGLSLDASYSDSRGYDVLGDLTSTKSTDLFAGVRVGYNLPLGRAASIWPRVTLGPYYDHVEQSIVTSSGKPGSPFPTATDATGVSGNVFVPLLLHPVPHLFFGFGPRVLHAFSSNGAGLAGAGDPTVVEGDLVVGGFWGGTPPEGKAEEASVTGLPAARMGDRGNVVLTAESTLSLQSRSYSGNGGHDWSVGVGPSVDYLVADHVSIGALLAILSSGADTTSVGGVKYTRSDSTFQIGARLGVELPLGSAVSWFPRATLGIEHLSSDLNEAGVDETWGTDVVWAGLYAPLLVHVASHAFAGMGPYVSRDLTSATTFKTGFTESVPASRVGASLLVGGWL